MSVSAVQCSAVQWSGVERNGAEWSGVEWNGVERSGLEWSGDGWRAHMMCGRVEWSVRATSAPQRCRPPRACPATGRCPRTRAACCPSREGARAGRRRPRAHLSWKKALISRSKIVAAVKAAVALTAEPICANDVPSSAHQSSAQTVHPRHAQGERAQGGTNILRERAEADGAGGFGASTLLVIAGPESKEEAAAATMELITNRTCTARWRAASHCSRLATSASSSGCSCSAAET